MAISVNADGSPQEGGFTVQHSSTGQYRMDFPAGTWTGSTGHFLLCVVNAINSTDTWLNAASAIAPIAADGSGSCSVGFVNASGAADTLFTGIVSVTP
jgi:hypothetical protein